MQSIKYLGVIPARLGSRRVKQKNIRLLHGKELIYYTITSANNSYLLDKTIFSTDSEIIRSIALSYDAFCPFLRPQSLSDDSTTNFHVIMHAVKWLQTNLDFNIENIVLLQPTSPFRTAKDIDAAISIFEESKYPTLASVTGPYKKRHPTLMKINKQCMTKYCEDSQEPYYRYNASIYICSLKYMTAENTLFSQNQSYYVMSDYQIDIDTEEDLKAAELIAPMHINK